MIRLTLMLFGVILGGLAIALAVVRRDASTAVLLAYTDGNRVVFVDTHGNRYYGETRLMTCSRELSWSPDARWIAYAAVHNCFGDSESSYRYGIYLQKLGRPAPKPLMAFESPRFFYSLLQGWSPQNERLFVRDETSLMSFSLKGDRQNIHQYGSILYGNAKWSADNQWVAYFNRLPIEDQNYFYGFYLLAPPEQPPHLLLNNVFPVHSTMEWSPDGAQLAMIAATKSDDLALYVIDMPGGELRRVDYLETLFPDDIPNLQSRMIWSPDQHSISLSDHSRLYTINLLTGHIDFTLEMAYPLGWRNGWLYFIGRDYKLTRSRIDGSERETLGDTLIDPVNIALSPNIDLPYHSTNVLLVGLLCLIPHLAYLFGKRWGYHRKIGNLSTQSNV